MKLNKKILIILTSIGGFSSSSYAYSYDPRPSSCISYNNQQVTHWHVSIVNNSPIAIKVAAENIPAQVTTAEVIDDNTLWTSNIFNKGIVINPNTERTEITRINDCGPYPVSGLKLRNISIKNDQNTLLKTVNLGSYTGAVITVANKKFIYDTTQFSTLYPLTYEVVRDHSFLPNFVWGISRENVKGTPQMSEDNFVSEPTLTFLPNTDWNGSRKDIYIKLIYNDGDKLELDLQPTSK